MQARILVPLDGSPVAEAVLPHAMRLARLTDRGLTLLRVVSTPYVVDPVLGMSLPDEMIAESREAALNEARAYLDGIAARLGPDGPATQNVVLEGVSGPSMLAYATDHPEVAAIAMATHGRTGLGRLAFGSVAEAVLHGTSVPVLLVHPAHAAPTAAPAPAYRGIVVPLDGSPFAEQALALARALAEASHGTLLLVASVPCAEHTHPGAEEPIWATPDQLFEVERLTRYLRRVARELHDAGLQVVSQVEPGHPADGILRFVEGVGADLIVMATHSRAGLARLRLGSVALKVIAHTNRPVLLVHPWTAALPHVEPTAASASAVAAEAVAQDEAAADSPAGLSPR